MDYSHSFPSGTVWYHFGPFGGLDGVVQDKRLVFLTDTNVFNIYKTHVGSHPTIVVPAGEESKSLATVQHITEQLIEMEADRQTLLVGVGGGVITDITGLVASMY